MTKKVAHADARTILKKIVPYLSGGKGHAPPELINEVRAAVGMKPLVVPGAKHADAVMTWLKAHDDGSGCHEYAIARGAKITPRQASEATRYLERHNRATKIGETRIARAVWPIGVWRLIPSVL